MTLQELLAIAAGGAIGALLRYGVSLLAVRAAGSNFPWGTLVVNVVGSFVIGLCWVLFERWQVKTAVRSHVLIGLLGAFTTFSSYTLDSLKLFEAGRVGAGLLYMVGSNGVGLTAVFLGVLLGRQLASL